MNKVKSDLPANKTNTDYQMIAFFDNRFREQLEFAANDFDAVVGFFRKRDFEKISSITLAQVLLTEAKKENIKIFKLLDTLKGLNKNQLNSLILEVLNTNRDKTSQLGFRQASNATVYEERNISDQITQEKDYNSLQFNAVVDISNTLIGVEQAGNIIQTRS